MKKIIFLVLAVLIVIGINNVKDDSLESIRFRVIANSNNEMDIKIKEEVSSNVQNYIISNTINNKNAIETRNFIKSNLYNIENIIKNTINSSDFKVNYGLNYFPQKKRSGKEYDAGMYESLVVSLGQAKGNNWWCILFPPLCLIEADDASTEEIKYDFWLSKIINLF